MTTYFISKKPPSANTAYPTNWKTKRRYKSSKLQEWCDFTTIELLSQKPSGLTGDFEMHIYMPIKFRHKLGDIVNLEKAISDILVSTGKIPDDRFIVSFAMRYAHIEQIEVTVSDARDYFPAG